MILQASAFVLLVVGGRCLADTQLTLIKNVSSMNWFQCQQNASWPVTCGSLAVPLDYTASKSTQTLELSLLKFNATKAPVKGSILFNPGGPGDGTRNFLADYAEEMLIATSGHYNLIAFDPRGTGDTLPFSCYNDDIDRQLQQANIPLSNNDSNVALGRQWTALQAQAEECFMKNKNIGGLMSTAFVARDMMQIVDALGEDGMLRFYGFSYGTVLGATAAAMFPDRMDKIVLDAVVNSYEWMAGTNREEGLQSDDTVRAYFKDCLENPQLCPIQRKDKSPDQLYEELLQVFDDVKFNSIVLGTNMTTGLIQYVYLKSTFLLGVKAGVGLTTLAASYLDAIMERNLTAYEESLIAFSAGEPTIYPPPPDSPESVFGIQCGDVAIRANELNTVRPLVKEYYEQTATYGDSIAILTLVCARWKMVAKERYTGPFKGKTKNPILFINSPYDPATPMVSARNMSSGFEGSVVLQQNGIGHGSIAQPSKCVIDATRDYFLNGTLLRHDNTCQPNYSIFTNKTLLELYKEPV